MLPQVTCYGSYKSENYGVNALCFTFPYIVDVYFSYKTIVAIRYNGDLLVSENCYSTTTGKHINAIDGGNKATRLPRSQFEQRVEAILAELKQKAS
jgi:hypothetical protein